MNMFGTAFWLVNFQNRERFMKNGSKKEAVDLSTTIRLGGFNEGSYSYHFFSAPIQKGYTLSQVGECLAQRYKKYGEVVLEKRIKPSSDVEEVLFTVIEPITNVTDLN
jgi:hypothetical protein